MFKNGRNDFPGLHFSVKVLGNKYFSIFNYKSWGGGLYGWNG